MPAKPPQLVPNLDEIGLKTRKQKQRCDAQRRNHIHHPVTNERLIKDRRNDPQHKTSDRGWQAESLQCPRHHQQTEHHPQID